MIGALRQLRHPAHLARLHLVQTDLQLETGQEIEQGQTVVILESMKMQNELKAPISGTVAEIHVDAGHTVNKNQILIEIEALEE